MTAEKGKRAAYALGYKLETVWTSRPFSRHPILKGREANESYQIYSWI